MDALRIAGNSDSPPYCRELGGPTWTNDWFKKGSVNVLFKLMNRHTLGIATMIALLLGGCSDSQEAAKIQELAAKFLLAEEPEGAVDVAIAKQKLTEANATDDVLLTGRVGLEGADSWDPTSASFLIRDLSLDDEQNGHDHSHEDDNCPFCKAKKQAALAKTAMIHVVDEAGNVPPFDARRLLGLEMDQVVVVRGKGRVDELGTLVVSANGVHIRR